MTPAVKILPDIAEEKNVILWRGITFKTGKLKLHGKNYNYYIRRVIIVERGKIIIT
jgi:hypothetical protein